MSKGQQAERTLSVECGSTPRDRIGLNFIRPDVGRPGNHDFLNSGVWLVSQFKEMGVRWNRLAFSWVLIQPDRDRFDWEPYDRIVEACDKAGIHLLATLGGHFDRPPVPAWAGESLAEVVRSNAGALERFLQAWVERYRGSIHYWEMLNEPGYHHKGLTVLEYVEGVLKPGYRIVKAADAGAVLPCSHNDLPAIGDKEDFWRAASGHCDIYNEHIYGDWGMFRPRPSAEPEEVRARNFRKLMEEHGEGGKPWWVTETGWWGTGSLSGKLHVYRRDPYPHPYGSPADEFRSAYTGREILDHPVVLREDRLRAEWMADLFPRLLSVAGCEKAFLWVSLDEFEGGYDPDRLYGQSTPEQPASHVDLWGIIAGDKTWRKSAFALRELISASSACTARQKEACD